MRNKRTSPIKNKKRANSGKAQPSLVGHTSRTWYPHTFRPPCREDLSSKSDQFLVVSNRMQFGSQHISAMSSSSNQSEIARMRPMIRRTFGRSHSKPQQHRMQVPLNNQAGLILSGSLRPWQPWARVHLRRQKHKLCQHGSGSGNQMLQLPQ